MLSCPACGTLVHADELKRLAAAAQQAEPSEALALWRQAIGLLPPDSQQYTLLASKIETISRGLEINPPAGTKPGGRKWKGTAAGTGGVFLMLLAKFKGAIFLLFGQGKLLLLGLTKMTTLMTMFASLGIYWRIFGWRLAVGGILCIYVHEMGHVYALRRLGIKATAPMFIPGFGAVIFLQQQFFSPREDARHGLAGPTWGLGASVIAALLGLLFHSPLCLLVAQFNAWINLWNLTPVWQLDGSRGFHALRRPERIIASLAFVAAWLPLDVHRHGDGSDSIALGVRLAFIAAACCVYGVMRKNEPEATDSRAIWQYVGLCAALTAFNWVPVPPVS
ncbi:peptidase M50 [Chthoniobacter flavus Ellin428]|uniref:Peptidase M50 n=2 Tax=Chthoniobacter flavus TaxID=191863 RepID=B4DBF6_9BACT|nr:peptidase M50 [Chthoniobacter flavus Ellin428]TCO84368.1 Zn-dependent protease [Chthoniobacter flavus]